MNPHEHDNAPRFSARIVRALRAPIVITALFLLLCYLGWPSRRAMPTPRAFAATLWREMRSPQLWADTLATTTRVLAGVSLSVALGAALGFALGRSRTRWRAWEATVDFLRSIPPILTFPFFLLALGFGESARTATIVAGTTGIVTLHVAESLARAPSDRREIAMWIGLSRWQSFRHLEMWEALPGLATGARVALAAGLVIAVVSEMLIGAHSGLGSRALDAQMTYRADVLWVVIVFAGALGMVLSSIVAAVERRLNRDTWDDAASQRAGGSQPAR